ncbi:hypothetical protein I4U23_014936 [Adineta vaga]|nr:hypothetical protein I4U23_014936 [Adineta vaga]
MNIIVVVLILSLFSSALVQSFQELSLQLSIKEEQPNGTLIVDLTSHFPSFNNTTSQGYLVKFVRPCPNIYLDHHNPFLLRALMIDREKLCPYERVCSFQCQLFLQKDHINFIQLKFSIEDINDHQAKFRKPMYSYELDQNLPLNYHLQLEQAEDQDYLSHHNYSLNSSSPFPFPFPFRLNFDENNHLLELILVDKLPLSPRKYAFELIVSSKDENGDEKEDDRCVIELEILSNEEKNSFPPEFQSKFYQFIVSNPNQTFIGQVHVVEKDQVFYRLISSNEQNLDLFQVNERTGEIFLKQKPSESNLNENYELFIEAFYPNYLSSLTTVQIFVNLTHSSSVSQQDYFIEILIPKLFQKNASNLNAIYLQENTSVPLTLLQLFISTSSLSLLDISMTSWISMDFREYFSLKQLDGDDQQSLELILVKPFDYEIIQQFHLDFLLNPFNFTRKSFDVFIENINDCQPHFDQEQFHFQIQENNPFPLLLHTFHALDPDQLNNDLIYEMQTQDQDAFALNATSGQLWIAKALDREVQSQYSFLVCVFDQRFRTCSSVNIDIRDENDNICSFNSSSLTLNINENLPPYTFLTQLQAFDPDYRENATLHYDFVSSTSYLTLNSSNGWIQTSPSQMFDYEMIQKYAITIKACDNIHSSPSLCCYLHLNIHLNDLDDNQPYLIYPANTDELLIINYTSKTMPQLKAFDNDIEMKNRLISYEIVGGSLNSSLAIDFHSGQLHLLYKQLPLYGTLIISLASQTIVHLTLLIHDHETDPQLFLLSVERRREASSSLIVSTLSSPLFYLIVSICIGISILILTPIVLMFYFCKQKSHHENNPLMTTPSTTTLSARSISTTGGILAKKLCETYYSFEETANHASVIAV